MPESATRTRPRTSSRSTTHAMFVRACVIGGLLGGIVFAWMLTRGSFDFLRWEPVSDFYDAQAHSLLRGRWHIDPDILGIEGFSIDGKSYMYFGPVPALFRVPLLAIFGTALDGRLARLSMLVAWAIAVLFACRIHWRVRTIVRGPAPLGRLEMCLVALFTFVFAGGSSIVFLSSRAWVFHEALLWAVAFALIALDLLVAYLVEPTRSRLLLVSAAASAAVLTRVTTGVGLVLALTAIALAEVARRIIVTRGRQPAALLWVSSHDQARAPVRLWVMVMAAVTPVVLYALVNLAKFGTLFSVPNQAQRVVAVDPHIRSVLAENGGSLFGLQFAPTTLLRYLRLDGLGFQRLFPFVDFASVPAPVGDARFELIDRSASVTASHTFLMLLAVIGIVALVRGRAWRSDARLRPLLLPVATAGGGIVGILAYAYVFERYGAEFLPVFVVAGALGLQVLFRAKRNRPRSRVVLATVLILVPLALLMFWTNFGLALAYGRLWSNNSPPSVVSGYLGFQRGVNNALGRAPIPLEQLPALPGGGSPAGRIVAIGDCEALYVHDGISREAAKSTAHWRPVELSAHAGHRVLDVQFPRAPVGTRLPIFTAGNDEDPQILFVEYLPDERIGFVFRGTGELDGPLRRIDEPIDFDRTYRLDVYPDWRLETLTVMLDDVSRSTFYFYEGTDFRVGRNALFPGVEPTFAGPIRQHRVTTPLCHTLLSDAAAG